MNEIFANKVGNILGEKRKSEEKVRMGSEKQEKEGKGEKGNGSLNSKGKEEGSERTSKMREGE